MPVPTKIAPRAPTNDGAGQPLTVQVRDYAWSDDVDTVVLYIPVPGVRRSGVTVNFRDEGFDMRAETDGHGTHSLSVSRLYERVLVPSCSHKVLERKEKVVISLRKLDPPGYGRDDWVAHKTWPVLHFSGGCMRLLCIPIICIALGPLRTHQLH
jgi:hypothetical protein